MGAIKTFHKTIFPGDVLRIDFSAINPYERTKKDWTIEAIFDEKRREQLPSIEGDKLYSSGAWLSLNDGKMHQLVLPKNSMASWEKV